MTMKKIAFISIAALLIACQQPADNSALAQMVAKAKRDTANKPKTEVHVNKKYDDKGNLLRYDSSYSYHYVSPGGKLQNIETDTLFRHFKSYYLSNYDTMFNNNFGSIFLNDSLFKYDFMQPDYFLKRYELNSKRFEQMARDMDSIKTQYLRQGYPQGEMKKKGK
jgi:hypothetical protein